MALQYLFSILIIGQAYSPFVGAKLIEYNFAQCPQVPTLHCRNGSQCTPGIAQFGKQHDHLDLQTHDSEYHCKCKNGFIGHECEIEVDECAENATGKSGDDGGPPSCYYGAKCEANGKSVICDCNKLNMASGDTDTKFAGVMCQHESTSFCASSLIGNDAPNHQFCTNHGKCVKMVLGNELHPGCECSAGWSGDHCEIRQDPFAVRNQSTEGDEGEKPDNLKVMIISLVISGVVVAVSMALVSMKFKKMKAQTASSSEVSFKGDQPARNIVDDLDADGSGTLGDRTRGRSADDDGELVVRDEFGEDEASADSEDIPVLAATEIV